MRRDARRLRRVPADLLILALALALALALPANALARRSIPDTSAAVHVWDDQLPNSMTDAQVRFVAGHVDGTQKVSRQTAERLRPVNPGFLVLHYRLGIGDGPVPFRIGDRWASDYASVTRHESWFWHQDGRRVFQSQWGWYLMNPDSGWRSYWAKRVLYEASLLSDDGVFADSLSVPQYLGANSFSPPLQYFVGEAAWTARINRFMRYEERRLHGRLWFIPNAGSWITTRDRTNYAIPDGVMVEGFAEGGPASFYALGDWQLQMDRALGLVRLGKVLIGQSYLSPGDRRARGFVLGSYLLIKGSHTFVNMDIGREPQWFPEYGIDLGPALSPPPRSIERAASGRRGVCASLCPRTGGGQPGRPLSCAHAVCPRPAGRTGRRRCRRRGSRYPRLAPAARSGAQARGAHRPQRTCADFFARGLKEPPSGVDMTDNLLRTPWQGREFRCPPG